MQRQYIEASKRLFYEYLASQWFQTLSWKKIFLYSSFYFITLHLLPVQTMSLKNKKLYCALKRTATCLNNYYFTQLFVLGWIVTEAHLSKPAILCISYLAKQINPSWHIIQGTKKNMFVISEWWWHKIVEMLRVIMIKHYG